MNKELAISILRGDVLGTNEQMHEAVFMAIKALKAEPVRHGKWDDTRVAFFRKCSECGATIKNNLPDVFLDCDIRDLHYCPNCGAKMNSNDSNDSNDSNALNALEMDEVNDDK